MESETDVSKNWRIAQELKGKGDNSMKEKNFNQAASHYHNALLYVKALESTFSDSVYVNMMKNGNEEEEKEKLSSHVAKLKKTVFSNLCLCLLMKSSNQDKELKMKSMIKIIKYADDMLKMDDCKGIDDKLLFRKTQALMELRRFDEAGEIMKILIKLKPSDKSVRELLTKVTSSLKDQGEREKETMRRMINK